MHLSFCSTVRHARSQKDFFPTKPFISSLQTGHNLRSQKQFTFF